MVGGGGWPRGWRRRVAIAAAESVVASSRSSSGGSNPGVAFRQRGWKSRETEGCPRRSLVLACTCSHSHPRLAGGVSMDTALAPWHWQMAGRGWAEHSAAFTYAGTPICPYVGARERERTVTAVAVVAEEAEQEGETGDRRRPSAASRLLPLRHPLLGYCATLTESCHSTFSCLLGDRFARTVYTSLMNDNFSNYHCDYFYPKEPIFSLFLMSYNYKI